MLNKDLRNHMLAKVEYWIRKSEREEDPFDQYVSGFLAFSILYNSYAKERNPDADLTYGEGRRAVEIGDLIADRRALVSDLAGPLRSYLEIIPAFREEYWGRSHPLPIASRLREAFYSENPDETVEYLLKWLYKVRCNIFHGEKNYDAKLDRTILGYSNKMIARILASALAGYKRKYA